MLGQTREDWEAEMEAVEAGIATELFHCYLCYLEQTGKPDYSLRADAGPLRAINQRVNGKGPDPWSVMVLSCGHRVI